MSAHSPTQAPTAARVVELRGGDAQGESLGVDLAGHPGAELSALSGLGLPVPRGFVVTAAHGSGSGGVDGAALDEAVSALLRDASTDGAPPLLVFRPSPPVAARGLLEPILGIGLDEAAATALGARLGDRRAAAELRCRFTQMFGSAVGGIDPYYFEEELYAEKSAAGVRHDHQLNAEQLDSLAARYERLYLEHTGHPIPATPVAQIEAALRATARAWRGPEGLALRAASGTEHIGAPAAVVHVWIQSEFGADSVSGTMSTRDPVTGAPQRCGEFVRGRRGGEPPTTPQPISGIGLAETSLQELMPGVWQQLGALGGVLEGHFGAAQEVQFGVERGALWLLGCREATLSPAGTVRATVELVDAGVLTAEQALARIRPRSLDALLHPSLDPSAPRTLLAKGLAASPGAVTGAIVLTAADAEAAHEAGRSVILVRHETTPDDIRGMIAARGVLTARGGITSHAAVVARQMGKTCVAGCGDLEIDLRGQTVTIGGVRLAAGDAITLDGSTGSVLLGQIATVEASMSPALDTLLRWADERRTVGVCANADTVEDAERGRRFGAEGIGLARTEHMFFDGDRIHVMREMIVADSPAARAAALERLRPFQRRDFEGIFRVMDGLPVTIRLLDPPLHEFLPERREDIEALGRSMGRPPAAIRGLVARLHEKNPMLGHRGCRLAISHPEIYEMQTRAIFDAALSLWAEGLDPRPQILVPLVSMAEELVAIRARIEAVAGEYGERGERLRAIPVGAMIELPRACATADAIAAHADFLSFGTNDLTQTVFGFSRDDVATFLPAYIERGLVKDDPFVVLDVDGVGGLIELACRLARKQKPEITIGICGEHAGEPRSVRWLQRGLVDYVSCSPYRVPIARVAAAQR
ncbi:MAG: pyruvate, phosphate dikinase [Myxococcales bacterium]|nr:pyruvate, phosphate dikinase [Myxococcales bacterium]MCB9519606.1 pyruvate, phosphate dikinase [Myxococcales bacterium]MCB9530667.1 pyruvate, phosphate dikinase [Myxococcales bacterium]MCB9533588.1 pyruvate, phosphate dikinase [Myxococcales bacterium]